MKMWRLLFLLCSVLMVTACSSDDDENNAPNYLPGEIPGLGEAGGQLTGTTFVLPTGIKLQEQIKGYGGYIYARSSSVPVSYSEIFAEKERQLQNTPLVLRASAASDADVIVGSGYFVSVLCILNSTNNTDTEVVFPAGLIVKALSSDHQNGVLLKKTSVVVPKNGSLKVALVMYCGNAGRSASSSSYEYEWGVVTNSDLILDLCNRLKDKKINFEEFSKNEGLDVYKEQVDVIQGILWSLTDGYSTSEGISESDKKWIADLPNSSN